VNKRLEKAIDELKDKHNKGTNEVDDPDRAPTGAPYRQIQRQQQQQAAALEQQKQLEREEQENREQLRQQVRQTDGVEGGSDDEFDDLLEDDNDPVLEAIRQKRILEMKQAQAKHTENMAKGHGQYRTISQDEFLPECTGSSEFVAIHFFLNEFERCKIMDKHLKIIAPRHTTCKFLRIDAEKAPFFVTKLAIRTLPTLIVFQDGKAVDRLTGFEGLASAADPDNFPTSKLQTWLADTGAIEFDMVKDEIAREELLQEQLNGGRHRGAIWSSNNTYDEDY
jgi:thiol-disulfide isomerase/thioredoxin